jgi:hypothetical protein
MRPAALSQLRLLLLLLVALASRSSSVEAQQWAKTPEGRWIVVEPRQKLPGVFDADPKVRLFGVTLLAGLPDGIAPGIAFHPGTNIVHVDLALTGLLSLGVRAGVTFDPLDWVLAPTLTVAGGYSAWVKLPSDAIYYQLYYVNVQPGLELGRRSRFRVFLRAGFSHFWVAGRHSFKYQGIQATSQPNLRINALPSVNLGLTAYFGP